jgi:FxsC-like protein
MGDYLFFLSYARRDAKGDPWLRQFYDSLVRDVGRKCADVKESDIGFFDEEGIETGNEWPWRLADALQKSKVFVCLYSNAYFKSEYCGKEFQIFRSRLDSYRKTHAGIAPGLILPVLWDPIRTAEQLPEAVADIQYQHADLGELYAKEGLAYLIRTKKKAEYQEFMMKFAEQIANASKHNLPPLPAFPNIKSVKSAFHATSEAPPVNVGHQGLPPSGILPRIAGPDVAWYVYFAGRQADYEGIRNTRECYGLLDGREWQPHLPPVDKKVGIITPTVAHEKNILTDVLPLTKDLIKNLRKAEETNTIAVLIVDPWSVRFESYRELMSDYDEYSFYNCGVIIVWNDNDEETKQNKEALQAEIRETFERNLDNIFFRDSVKTEDEFRNELSAIIEKVRERLMNRAKPVRPIPSTGAELFPTISGQ